MIISTIKHYDAVVSVLDLLNRLSVPTADDLLEDVCMQNTCGNCENFHDNCCCDDDGGQHGRHYAEYDDEASFE